MNLVRGRHHGASFEMLGIAVPLAGPVDAPQPGQELLLGVRPEHLLLDDASPWRGEVSVVEPTGPDTYVVVDTSSGTLTLRTGAQTPVRPGDRVGISVAPGHAHWFDGASEMRRA